MSVNFPIILFNSDKEKLRRTNVIRSSTFYFYSYQLFNVSITSADEGVELYSVKNVNNVLNTVHGTELSDNHGYTLYMPNNNSTAIIRVYTDTYSIEYTVKTIFENVFDTTNQHYKDLLANYNLPTSFDLLADAVPDEFDESELLKRLLLDYQEIQKYSGTKKGIRQYLKFLGFDEDQLTVTDIYHNPVTDTDVLIPNKKTDYKTGDYHVLYLNYDDATDGYNSDNMPIRYLIIEDIDGFKFAILNAITLSNLYFTTDEQDITYFGLGYSSNNAKYLGMIGDMHIINEHNVIKFKDDIKIGMSTNETKTKVIKNTLLKTDTLYASEAKVEYSGTGNYMYVVEKEYFDADISGNITKDNLINVRSIFGCVLHLKINSPDTYIAYTLIDNSNPLIRVTRDKTFYDAVTEADAVNIYDIIAISTISTYTLTITVWDKYNNRDVYTYDFGLSTSAQRIDFNSFNTSDVSDDYKYGNNVSLNVQNESIVSSAINSLNFILPQASIPDDLSSYFNTVLSSKYLKYLQTTEIYKIPDLNTNLLVNQVTETLPFYYSSNWVYVISRQYEEGWSLKIRLYDAENCETVIVNIRQISEYDPVFDNIYVQMADLYVDEDAETSYPYYYIMTTVPGIDFNKDTYDLLLVNDITGEIKSFYDDMEPTKKIYIPYDFPLFALESDTVESFNGYISDTEYTEAIVEGSDEEYPMIKSIFPRMINIDNQIVVDEMTLAYGDFILCILDSKYVVGVTDIIWTIYNAFTSKVLFTTTDATLKYQISDNTIYTIGVEFKIAGMKYNIKKESLFSSFETDI